MDASRRTVAVLGASDNPDRYSNRAVRMLRTEGYRVLPVHPTLAEIDGLPVVHALGDISEPVDTLTLYIGPDRCAGLVDDILRLRPGRVIFNPGTELPVLEKGLADAAIPFLKACTLVMLSTGQF